MRVRLLILLLGPVALCSSHSIAQWIDDSLYDAHTRTGINYVYNLEFENARREFQQLVTLKADHPAGHFFLAMVEWWRILVDLENTSHDDRFYSMLERVIDLCDRRLEKDENEITALFFKGGSLGSRGRLRAHREEWLKAANDGRLALPIVRQAYKLAPTNFDVQLGMGIYNYYAEVIPEQYPFVKPVMIFFPKGDKEKGIGQLRKAAEKSKYAGVEASYFLLQIFHNYEKEYTQTLPIAQRLHARFPNNPIFHKYLGRSYAALARWSEMKGVFEEINDRVERKEIGYGDAAEREAEYYLGLHDMTFNRLDSALRHFLRCDELSRSLDKDGPSVFMTMANLKMGMIYDLQAKREVAVKQYEKVLAMDDYMDSRRIAAGYLQKPYEH